MKNFILSFLVFACFSSFAQQDENQFYFNELSLDYGIFASLNSAPFEDLTGNRLNVQGTRFYLNNFGLRTGVSFMTNLEGSNTFFAIPMQLVYRTAVYKNSEIYIDAVSLTDFFFQLIVGLMPKQFEFNLGTSLGYIDPNENASLVRINNGPWFEEGFGVDNRFVSTIDFGFRAKYKIKRIGITLSPNVSYFLTQNFRYSSELNLEKEYDPQLFLSLTFGLSYEF